MPQFGQRVVWLPTVHTGENPFTSFPDSIPSRILRKYRTSLSHLLRFLGQLEDPAFSVTKTQQKL